MLIHKPFNERKDAGDLRLEICGASAAGHCRIANEDAFSITDFGGGNKLFAVADGFDGAAGEIASRLAVCELRERMRMLSARNAAQRLRTAFEMVGAKINPQFEKRRGDNVTGTTLTAIFVSGDTAFVAHVGNTRAYRVRNGALRLLTKDDTFAQVLIDNGAPPSPAAPTALLQFFGAGCDTEPMLAQTDVLPGDLFLLCSDGFSNSFDAAETLRIIEADPNVSTAVNRLVEAADERDGADNITIVLARAFRAASAAAARRFYHAAFQPAPRPAA